MRIAPSFGRPFALALLAVALSGCVSGGASLLHANVNGDRDRVVITGEKDSVAALALAVAHCSSYGRSARAARTSGNTMIYDCVAAR